jgi:CMP-N-acetylneuraminic acid synthetase
MDNSNRGPEIIGLIPARGGSKSIPLKNMAQLGGRPLMEYVIKAAQACPRVTTICCSTEHSGIADFCVSQGVQVIERPEAMAQDDSPVVDVIRHCLESRQAETGSLPQLVVLLQPTSPFLLPEHIAACIDLLLNNPDADSAQTITAIAHNNHAFNQRTFTEQRVRFKFAEERKKAYNKQRKPKLYKFGNLVVSRSTSILAGKDPFGDLSLGVEIKPPYDIDVDGPDDLEYATYLLEKGKASVPFILEGVLR